MYGLGKTSWQFWLMIMTLTGSEFVIAHLAA